jgi:hypothetical protein
MAFSRNIGRRRLNKWLAVIGIVMALSGCATTRVSLDYESRPVTTSSGLTTPIVTFGTFVDDRKQASNWLGAIRGGYGNPLKVLETPVPVSEVVRDAFVSGARARGMLADPAAAKYTASVVVNRFDCNQYARREAHISLTVTLRDNATGQTVVTEPVRRDAVTGSVFALDAGIFGSIDDLRAVAMKVLQDAVDSTLDGATFAQLAKRH